jgi:hypothetical protein
MDQREVKTALYITGQLMRSAWRNMVAIRAKDPIRVTVAVGYGRKAAGRREIGP